MTRARALSIATAIFLGAAWIFYVAGNASASWSSISINSGSVYFGLWKAGTCVSGVCKEIPIDCNALTAGCSKLIAARAFMTLACIFTPFAVAYLIFIALKDKFEQRFIWIGIGLIALCFVFGLIGIAIGISFVSGENNFQIGAAAAVSVVGVFLNFISFVVAWFVRQN